AGLNLVAGINARSKQQFERLISGLFFGGAGGAMSGYAGEFLYSALSLPAALSWMLLGTAVGLVEGLYERSPIKLRNGLISGSLGGLMGGLLFQPILRLISTESGVSGRATAFVVLGIFIGGLIGLVKVVPHGRVADDV